MSNLKKRRDLEIEIKNLKENNYHLKIQIKYLQEHLKEGSPTPYEVIKIKKENKCLNEYIKYFGFNEYIKYLDKLLYNNKIMGNE